MRIDFVRERQHRDEKYGWKRCPQEVDLPSPTFEPCRRDENAQPSRQGTSLPSSSPETMSFSSPELRHSSDEDDSESDANPLLVAPIEDKKRSSWRKMFDDKGTSWLRDNDALWCAVPDHSWSSSEAVDHGYHSMDPLTHTSPDNLRARANANVMVTLAGDYPSTKVPVPKAQMVTAINNNRSTETLWHSSAWSAPRKAHSYSSCTENYARAIEKCSSGSRLSQVLQRTQSDSCAWNTKGPHESVNHLYINKSANFYSINESSSDLGSSWDDVDWPNQNSYIGVDRQPDKTNGQDEDGVLKDPSKRLKTSKSCLDDDTDTKDAIAEPKPCSPNISCPESSRLLEEKPVACDINLATRSFNNFSISSNKRQEILRLLQERRKTRDSNIFELQAKGETKILNTGRGLLRTNRRHAGRAWTGTCPDGLVLEKVRYDPNWRRQNSTLCSSDGAYKQFCRDERVSKPLSVPCDSRKEDSPPAQRPEESPTENASPKEGTDLNSNEKPPVEERPKEEEEATKPEKGPDKSISKRFAELLGDFDVYDIESTMPTIDWAAMEAHLAKAAEEDDWSARRRNDREEIRRRLAFGSDADDYYYLCGDRLTKKPSLTTRLQSGMNLQICFMNETASDSEEGNSDHEGTSTSSSLDDGQTETKCLLKGPTTPNNNTPRTLSTAVPDGAPSSPTSQTAPGGGNKRQRPSFFFPKQRSWRLRSKHKHEEISNPKDSAKEVEDFYTRHARLQAEARLALAQAKEMAKMQMEIERQKCKKSPISDIVGLSLPNGKNSALSSQMLNSMNIAQLQVIVNDLHTQIETLNEDLVRMLLTRDDLHMEQDSMLVDIEDLTRYLNAKESGQHPLQSKILSK